MRAEHRQNKRRRRATLAAVLLAAALAGCDNMADGARVKPLEASPFFEDRMAARPHVDGTVPRGHLEEDPAFFTGLVDGERIQEIPLEVTPALMARGQERFAIHCTPCHGQLGDGNGIVVLRGFPQPPTYHQDRLRQAPAGHLFDVITNGFGRMYPFGSRIAPQDRWAIIAYIRALQLSRHAPLDELPAATRQELEGER